MVLGSGFWVQPRNPEPVSFAIEETSSMPTVDELMRRYEDLSKRAADLRSYL
jgi:hypothetical protein